MGAVTIFYAASRRPAGPHAPPPRRARLRSRWRSRYGGANASRLARKQKPGRLTYSKFYPCRWTPLLPLPGLSGAGQNLSRPSVTVGQPPPSRCRDERTREDGLDRTCPDLELGSYREQGQEWSGTDQGQTLDVKTRRPHARCVGIVHVVVALLAVLGVNISFFFW
jgi:hypothetical protein